MITVAVSNQKGGVGKTTVAVNLAAALAGAGKRVVLVDTDPQGNVAKWFGLPEESGVYNLLIKEQNVVDLLRLVPREQWWPDETSGVLAILPGNARTTTAGVMMAIENAAPDLLRRALEPLQHSVDFVILDTSPTVTELMSNVFVASDLFDHATETRVLSVNGVIKTMGRIETFQKDIALRVVGIVPTRHSPRQVECKENLATLQQLYGDLVWSPIVERTQWSESPSFGKSVFAYAPRTSKAVKEAACFTGQFLQITQGVN